MPRSPALQSPGGRLKSASVRELRSSRSIMAFSGYSYGKRNSTAVQPAPAATSKRSRNGHSLNMKLRLAAKRGIDPPNFLDLPGLRAGAACLDRDGWHEASLFRERRYSLVQIAASDPLLSIELAFRGGGIVSRRGRPMRSRVENIYPFASSAGPNPKKLIPTLRLCDCASIPTVME
jgi:hypothetical protein